MAPDRESATSESGVSFFKGEKMISVCLEKSNSYHSSVARALGGVMEAVYFENLYIESLSCSRDDGFFPKTKEKIEEETCIKRYQQDRIRRKLEQLGVIETVVIRDNGLAKVHFRVVATVIQEKIYEEYAWQKDDESLVEIDDGDLY
jgi:hypothetical protein